MRIASLLGGLTHRLPAVLSVAMAICWAGIHAGVNPAVEAFNDSIVFYLSFDEEILDADLAAGIAAPAGVQGTATFAPGVYGQALVMGGKNGPVIDYLTAGNIDFSAAGALSFWMAPLEWIQRADADRRGTLRFLSMQGVRRGGFFIQRQGFSYTTREDGSMSRRHDRFHVGLYNLPDWDNVMHSSHFSERWQPLDWKLIVVNWDRSGYAVSIDGTTPERREFSRFMDEGDFPPNQLSGRSSTFTLGYQDAHEFTLLDEFTVYRRPLTEAEIQKLYDFYAGQ